MIHIYIALVLFVSIFTFWIFTVFFSKKKRKLAPQEKKKFLKKQQQIQRSISEKEKIIDYDKLYHKIFQGLGYSGDFGSILKSEPKQISDIQKIWKLHKVRNKLVHDLDDMSVSVLRKYVKEYEREVERLLGRV